MHKGAGYQIQTLLKELKEEGMVLARAAMRASNWYPAPQKRNWTQMVQVTCLRNQTLSSIQNAKQKGRRWMLKLD